MQQHRYTRMGYYWWLIRHWWYNHVSGPFPAFVNDLREDMAMYGLRQLVGGIVLFHWDKFTQPVRLSPLGTFIHKSRQYDRLVATHLRTVDAYRERVQMCGELRDHLRAYEAQDNAEIWELRKQVEAWQSFYDWMCDDGRLQEHEIEPSM